MSVLAPPQPKIEIQPEYKRWTQAEFHAFPEGPPYYELYKGDLIEMPRPRRNHQKLIGKIFAILSAYIEENLLGDIWPEVEVDITPEYTFVPDLAFLKTDNLYRFDNELFIEGAPDLVVEIATPSTSSRDKSIKAEIYHSAGVFWYWIVEEDLLILEYKYTEEGYLLNQAIMPGAEFSPTLFPGLTINLAKLLGENVSADVVAGNAIAEENNDE